MLLALIILGLIALLGYRIFFRRPVDFSQLNNKVVLISGGGSGIGREIAHFCAEHGAKVAICGRRLSRLNTVKQEIEEKGGECIAVKADCAIQSDVKQFVEEIISNWGQLDVVYINHMWGRVQALLDIPEDQLNTAYHDAYDSTVFGMMALTFYSLPLLQKTGGSIVQVSSMSAFYGVPKCSLYAGTKAAGHRFFDCLRIELGKNSNVSCTVACPGLIDTQTARDYIPAKDLAGAMDPRTCAIQIVEGGLRRVRELHMNLVAKPPIYGPLVYYVSALFPSLMDTVMFLTYPGGIGEGGIADATPKYPIE